MTSKPRMCPHCRAFIDPKARVCEYCGNEVGQRYKPLAENPALLRGFVLQSHYTTFLLLAVNFALFVVTLVLTMKRTGGELSLFGGAESGALIMLGAMDARFVRGGEWWRLVTAGFLHGGVLHLLMNSWVLFDLGAQVERVFETPRYLVIYLLSSMAGFYTSFLWGTSLSVGASAAACGLIGAMMAYARLSGSSMLWSFYLRWALYILVLGLIVPMIDNAAHIGGGLAGFALAYIARLPGYNRSTETMWKIAAGLTVAGLVVCFGLSYLSLERFL